jgi:hypothetical protein
MRQLKTLGMLTLLIAQTAFAQTKEYTTIMLPAGLTGTPTSVMSDPGIARRKRNMISEFSKRYDDWLISAERKKLRP